MTKGDGPFNSFIVGCWVGGAAGVILGFLAHGIGGAIALGIVGIFVGGLILFVLHTLVASIIEKRKAILDGCLTIAIVILVLGAIIFFWGVGKPH